MSKQILHEKLDDKTHGNLIKWQPYCLIFVSDAPFTLEVENHTKNWDGTLESSDDGVTWSVFDGTGILSSNEYNKIYLRGSNNTHIILNRTLESDVKPERFVITGVNVRVLGNIETLLDYQTVEGGGHPTMGENCFQGLFYKCSAITYVSPDLLPSPNLSAECYKDMFNGCTSLVNAPELPSTALTARCYKWMFDGCTSLIQVPILIATKLSQGCYNGMFDGCTSIKLSATRTGEYTISYRIPTSETGTDATNALTNMFDNTSGTFIGTPEINTTYYLSNTNRIV